MTRFRFVSVAAIILISGCNQKSTYHKIIRNGLIYDGKGDGGMVKGRVSG